MSDLLKQTKDICRLLEIKLSRSKGQNFLIKEKIYEEIIQTAELKATDTVLEVGPGLGFLTLRLAEKVKKVLAVELDSKLADYLKIGLAASDNVKITVFNEDILHFNTLAHQLVDRKYKIVANLPYNISAIFLRRFLSGQSRPQSLVLMLQQEVAERISAKPPKMSILAVAVQYYARVKIIRTVAANNFWPEPKVNSALIKFIIKDKKYSAVQDKAFFRIVKIGFSAKRKMLKNNLAAGLKIETPVIEKILVKQKLNSKVRAEALSLKDWQKLFATLSSFVV